MSLNCENLGCSQIIDGECTAASMLRNQANTIKSPLHRKERLSKRAFGTAITAYETTVANRNCRASDEALRLALKYARNIHQRMPEDPVK